MTFADMDTFYHVELPRTKLIIRYNIKINLLKKPVLHKCSRYDYLTLNLWYHKYSDVSLYTLTFGQGMAITKIGPSSVKRDIHLHLGE